MGVLDILFIVIFILAVVFGFYKGFISQLGTVVGILAGIIVCRIFLQPVARLFIGSNPSEEEVYISSIVCCVLLFVIAFVVVKILAKGLTNIAHKLCLSPIDRVAGSIFCVFEWFLIVSILLNVWQVLTPNTDITDGAKRKDGKLIALIINFAPNVLGNLQADLDKIEQAATTADRFKKSPIGKALADPEKRDQIESVATNPVVNEVLSNPELMDAVSTGLQVIGQARE